MWKRIYNIFEQLQENIERYKVKKLSRVKKQQIITVLSYYLEDKDKPDQLKL